MFICFSILRLAPIWFEERIKQAKQESPELSGVHKVSFLFTSLQRAAEERGAETFGGES